MMLSRVADSLYWIGRYVERAEHVCRLLQITLTAGLEGGSDEAGRASARAMAALGGEPGTTGVRTMALSQAEPGSAFFSVAAARENARQVRDQITTEMWERLNRLYFRMRDAKSDPRALDAAFETLGEYIGDLHAFKGIVEGTMSHGEGFRFLSLGRMIERAQLVSRILEIHMAEPLGTVGEFGWAQCLRMCCGLEPFLRARTADFRREVVADFLVLDPEFPRSLRHCVNEIERHLSGVGPKAHEAMREACARQAGRLRARLDFATLEEVTGRNGRVFIPQVASECAEINDAVNAAFISYAITARLAEGVA